MCRSPTALTVRSMREWRARRSSIWSKKPMPVAIMDTPDPSRFTVTSMSVSLVLRLIVAVRMESWLSLLLEHDPYRKTGAHFSGSCSLGAENAGLLTAKCRLRYCGIALAGGTSVYGERNLGPERPRCA